VTHADWHDWYIEACRIATEARPHLAVGEIVRSWLHLARPIALRVAPETLSADMRRGDDGAVYWLTPAPHDSDTLLHIASPDGPAILRSPDGSERSHEVDDPLNPAQTRSYHTLGGRRRYHRGGSPYRNGPQPRPIARALAVRGLMESGATHGAALRAWAMWPESDPPAEIRRAAERMIQRRRGSRHLPQLERDARLFDRQTWTSWERAISAEDRRIWQEAEIDDPRVLPMVTDDRR
jgi:hypothetical protein